MRSAKVTFGLLANSKEAGKFYIFDTDLELQVGEHVIVDSKNKESHAIFVGYYNGKRQAEKKIIRKADTKEITTDDDFNKNFDYKVKWNQKMENGCGEWEYFNDEELDNLERNWNTVKQTL